MSSCGAIFVVLAEDPAQDRLERCTRPTCPEHTSQLAWVEASFPRQVAYQRQVARYTQQHPSTHAAAAEQPSLLAVTGEP